MPVRYGVLATGSAQIKFVTTSGTTSSRKCPSTWQVQAAQALSSRHLMRDGQPNLDMAISRSIWAAANPGYVFREGSELKSVAKSDYTWDEQEVCPLIN